MRNVQAMIETFWPNVPLLNLKKFRWVLASGGGARVGGNQGGGGAGGGGLEKEKKKG